MGASTKWGSRRSASATPDDVRDLKVRRVRGCGPPGVEADELHHEGVPVAGFDGVTQRVVADASSVRGDRLSEGRRSGRVGQLGDLMARAGLPDCR